MIRKSFIGTFKYLKKHPQILVPRIIFILILFLLAYAIGDHLLALNEFVVGEDLVMPTEITLSIIYVLTYSLVVFLMGVAFSAIFYGLISDILKKDKCLLSNCKKHLKNFFKPVLFTQLWMGVIYFIGAIIAFIPSVIANALGFNSAAMTIFGVTVGIISFLIVLGLFFRYPLLILENKKPLESLKQSYYFLKKEPRYVLFSALIVGVIYLAGTFAIYSFNLLELNVFTVSIIPMFAGIVELIYKSVIDIFTFSAYHYKTSKKKKN